MLLPADQRRLLGAFLRARREALTPACVAEAAVFPGRRRTPGLRREEVAQLCGMSSTWYSWIEQGRDISLSAGSLARLADALRLTAAERAYLFELSRRRDPSPALVERQDGRVPAELRAVLQTAAAPAYLMDRRWHALAWNDAAGRLFSPGSTVASRACCATSFSIPERGISFAIGKTAPVASSRSSVPTRPANPEDPAIKTLVEDLQKDSPAFSRLWNSHAVLTREGGTAALPPSPGRSFALRADHPGSGTLPRAPRRHAAPTRVSDQ